MTIHETDYSPLDQLEVLLFLFHPRRQSPAAPLSGEELTIPLPRHISLGARWYHAAPEAPSILFFHGNGEIVEDYDDLGPVLTRLGINFFPVDYRGYGLSTGTPTVSAMMEDAHEVYRFFRDFLIEKNCTGPAVVMGRSLGSAPALELALHYAEKIDGLVIESGFARLIPLLRTIGVMPEKSGITRDPLENINKIRNYHGPTLVIHAERDHIIPLDEGRNLYGASPDPGKKLLIIPGANHNTIFALGLEAYLKALTEHLFTRCRK